MPSFYQDGKRVTGGITNAKNTKYDNSVSGLTSENVQDVVDEINSNMDIIDEKVQECFQSVSNGKTLLASGITDKGVPTDADATFQKMYDNVMAIQTNPTLQSKTVALSTSEQVITADTGYDGLSQVNVPAVTGTASASDVLAGKTFGSASGVSQKGTLADKTGTTEYTATSSLDSTNSELEMTVPANGYYNTSNKLKATFSTIASLIGLTSAKLVKGNTILGISGNSNNMDTSGGDATAAQILSGKKACVDGSLLTGTMTNNGAVAGTISTSGGTYTVPAGYHNGSGKVTGPTLAGLIGTNVTLANAANLLTGNTAYGKNGTKYTGTMANKGGTTVESSAVTQDDDYTYLTIPANGYYNTSSKIKTANSKLNSNLGSKAELLWENPNPTDAFQHQKILLDLSKYNAVIIESYNNCNEDPTRIGICFKNSETRIVHVLWPDRSDSWWYGRIYQMDDNGVNCVQTVGIAGPNAYSVAIPQKIYGCNVIL